VRQSGNIAHRATIAGLKAAVHRSKPLSRAGVLERLFTLVFKRLVYPQIWEDPVVDMKALDIGPGHEVIAIASGGCNVLSYLTADPAGVTAVDLNGAHIALGRLKICAAQNLPDYDSFFRFFGRADARANVAAYDRRLRTKLDPSARAYWDKRTGFGRRRIGVFAHNFYHHGLLGHVLGAAHALARLHGLDPSIVLKARTLDEQRALYEKRLAPIFDKPLIGWLLKQPASLYGLGIPPAQYRALSADSPQGIGVVLSERLERLACGFDITDNYFAWQAFGRRYAPGPSPALPPYLQKGNFDAVRGRSSRVHYVQRSFTDILRDSPSASFDRYALLDAQDWMNDTELTALWVEITRTARPDARVIFRTAAAERLLPGRVPDDVLGAWRYEDELSQELTRQDRSSIYGAFHLYTLKSAPDA
jgi:S-adenosylmethionine-diacylglycerol 3-amino-3-carboxypropyl transferase